MAVIAVVEWEPKSIAKGYGIHLNSIARVLGSQVTFDCFYQGYQELDGQLGHPSWRIFVTTDQLWSLKTLPSRYGSYPINWVSNRKKTCGKKIDPSTNKEIYGYQRRAPYLRIANKTAKALNFKFNGIPVKVYSVLVKDDALVILEH